MDEPRCAYCGDWGAVPENHGPGEHMCQRCAAGQVDAVYRQAQKLRRRECQIDEMREHVSRALAELTTAALLKRHNIRAVRKALSELRRALRVSDTSTC